MGTIKRKLASIRKIKDVQPIEGADKICKYLVDGWWVVDSIGKYSIGDKVVYFEVDSVLPIRNEFEFLRKNCFVKKQWLPNGEGFRLRTLRLRGQLSQGLIFPLPEGDFQVGDDVTDFFGVVKWDPPVPAELAGIVRGVFPSFIQKTDQERVQNIWTELKEKFNDILFEVTIKLDGSSCTFYHNNQDVGVCSRNLNLKLEGNENNTFVRYALEKRILESLKKFGQNVAIQGEMIGPGIQGNRENLKAPDFFVFDVFLIDKKRYATPFERKIFLDEFKDSTGVDLNHVPIIDEKTLDEFEKIGDILAYAEGGSLNNSVREGVVFKSKAVIEGKIVSFKVISNKFLLEED